MNAIAIQPSQVAREGNAIIHKYSVAGEIRVFLLAEELIMTITRREVRNKTLTKSVSRDTTVHPASKLLIFWEIIEKLKQLKSVGCFLISTLHCCYMLYLKVIVSSTSKVS